MFIFIFRLPPRSAYEYQKAIYKLGGEINNFDVSSIASSSNSRAKLVEMNFFEVSARASDTLINKTARAAPDPGKLFNYFVNCHSSC